jgi:hypothetical protein
MGTSFSNPRLVSFNDHLAPYRGSWVIYAASSPGRFAACHEFQDPGQALRVLEQRQLNSTLEARRFSSHLILHGWSPDEIHQEQGYSLLWT